MSNYMNFLYFEPASSNLINISFYLNSVHQKYYQSCKYHLKIQNCVDEIKKVFGDGDTRDHGKVAIEYFEKINEQKELWDVTRGHHQKAGCFNNLTGTTYYDDIYGYYLSFENYLDSSNMPPYPTFCEGIIENLKTNKDGCVRILIIYFGEDMEKALKKIFYETCKYNMNPQYLSKTKDFVEDEPTVTNLDNGEVVYRYPSRETLIKRTDGKIDHQHPNGEIVATIPHHEDVLINYRNEIFVTNCYQEVVTFPKFNATFGCDDNEVPENTVNIGVLYIDKVIETYGLKTATMPPPQDFCRERHT